MSGLARLALLGLVRAPGRSAVRIVSLGAAVALIGAMILFVGHSLRTMTASATRSVPLDWQGPVGTYSAAQRVAAAVARQPGVQQASPLATAPFASIVHQAAVGTIRSGSGAVLAVPPRSTTSTLSVFCVAACVRARSSSTSNSRPRCRSSPVTW